MKILFYTTLLSLFVVSCGSTENKTVTEGKTERSDIKENLNLDKFIKGSNFVLKAEKMQVIKYPKNEAGSFDMEHPFWEEKSNPIDADLRYSEGVVWRWNFSNVELSKDIQDIQEFENLPFSLSDKVSGLDYVRVKARKTEDERSLSNVDIIVYGSKGEYRFITYQYMTSTPSYIIEGVLLEE